MSTKKTTAKKPTFKERIKDMADIITAVTVIGTALLGVGSWCFSQANASTNAKLDTISSQINGLEMDSARSQLLVLMSDYPDNESEILKVADYYFNNLNGDWYMTDLFVKWAESRNINVDEIVKIKK